jgi:hypothetical protein
MFTLSAVVPWGRSFDECQRMFALGATICGSPSSAAVMAGQLQRGATRQGSASRHAIRSISSTPTSCASIDRNRTGRIEQTRQNAHSSCGQHRLDRALRDTRMAATGILADFAAGKAEGRYIDAALPELPFADETFDLALSSHFLFLYTAQLGDDFHRRAIREMCRVAREVRIFPLVALGGAPSPLVDVAVRELMTDGFTVSIDPVPYEFQRGANQMLRIRRRDRDQPHA